MVSIDDFKKAFGGAAATGRPQGQDRKVEDALKRLKAAIDQAGATNGTMDGPRVELKQLVQRFAAVRTQAGAAPPDAASELDKIFRRTEDMIGGLQAPAADAGPLSADTADGGQAKRSSQRSARKTSRKKRTGVVLVPSIDTVRAGLEKWVAKNISRSRASGIVNLSNVRELHQDASVLELFGAEILAEVTTGSGGAVSVQFSWDPKFQGPDPNKYWNTDPGKVALIIEVIDSKSGVPVKGARVRFNGGPAAVTDAKGRAKVESPANKEWNVEVSAPGYQNTTQRVTVGDSAQENAIRLTPIDTATVEKVVMGITVIDMADGTKIQKAKVKIGRETLLTDVDGFVNFYLLPGIHPFTVTARDYVNESGNLDVPESKEQEFHTIAIKPSGAEDVFVRILDAQTGDPIRKALVRVGSQGEHTDIHGEARIGGLPFGEHRIWVSAAGYTTHDRSINHSKKTATTFKVVELDPE